MEIYEDKSKKAIEILDIKSYRKDIEEKKNSLKKLRDELKLEKENIIESLGYVGLEIDGSKIYLPENIGFQQAYIFLQKMPNRLDKEQKKLYYVTDEDLDKIQEKESYKTIIDERKKIIEEIHEIYEEFWNKEVMNKTKDKKDSIIYFIAGLGVKPNTDILSNITGYSKSYCREFKLDGEIVKQEKLDNESFYIK